MTQLAAVLESKSRLLLAPEAGPFCREGGAKRTGSIGPSVKHWQMVSFLPASQSSWPPMEAAAQVPYVEPCAGFLDSAICWMVENLGRRCSSKYSRRLGAVISPAAD